MTSEAPFDVLVVVGFGLIGASVAQAAKVRGLARRIIAVDHPDILRKDVVRRVADVAIEATEDERVIDAVRQGSLIVLASPVGSIEKSLPRLCPVATLMTDCGSTKRSVARAASGVGGARRFVPGHPMAGDSRSGAEHAREDLFVDRSWILCAEGSDDDAALRVERFVTAIGARPIRMSADAHDRAVALTSHVPQLLASALAVLAEERAAELAAGPAFESATRVAGGSAAMWGDILATNADEVAGALRALSSCLETMADGLEASPPRLDESLGMLARARRARKA